MKLKHIAKSLLASTAIFSIASTQAATLTWDDDGIDSEFSTALNWDTNTVPTFGTPPVGDFTLIDGEFTVERSIDSNVQNSSVNGGATLNIPSGAHSDSRPGNTVRTIIGNNSVGAVNQSGGSWNIGHIFVLGNNTAGSATYNQSGGDLIISRGSPSPLVPYDGLELGPVSYTIAGSSAPEAFHKISGGSLTTRFGTAIGANGTFSVVGSTPDSVNIGTTLNGTNNGFWLQQGTLKVGIDTTATGVTPIFIDDSDHEADSATGEGGDVIFRAGSLLDVSYLGNINPGTYTVMTWDGELTDEGLAFASGVDTDVWSFTLGSNSLTVSSIDQEKFEITAFSIDQDTNNITFQWNAEADEIYTIFYTTNLLDLKGLGDLGDDFVDNGVADTDPAVGIISVTVPHPDPTALELFLSVHEN